MPSPSPSPRSEPNATPISRAPQQEQVVASIPGFSKSSPVKNTHKNIDSRQTLEGYITINDSNLYEDDDEFLLHHLSPLPTGWEQPQGDTFIADIEGAGTVSARIYTPFSRLLDLYSDSLYRHAVEQGHPNLPAYPYVFLPHYRAPPADHPMNVRDKADIVVAVGPASGYKLAAPGREDYQGVKFQEVISMIECKPEKEKGDKQAATYLFQLLEARPDMPGVYGLALRPQGYEILWSDASGVIGSGEYRWNDLIPLASYVFSLYVPPPGHYLWDTTLKPCPPPQDEEDPSLDQTTEQKETHKTRRKSLEPISWNLIGRDGGSLTFERYAIGNPWGRRTDIYKHVGEDGQIMMMKDAYWDTNRRYNELECLKMIHEDGIFPGVVRILPCEVPDIKTTQRFSDQFVSEPEKMKTRMLMASYGVAFEQAESVLDLLMAAYDINEVHRELVNQKEVLHRDISEFNVLMYPKHHHLARGDLMQNPPRFIQQVLNPTASQEADADMSTGLLIDFDNSAYPKDNDIVKPKCRTGTPRFIARSVASGQILDDEYSLTYLPMPHLSSNAKQVYINAYGQKAYDDYNDSDGTVHRGHMPDPGATPPTYFHRPHHDVESIFWVLLTSLLNAQPKEVDPRAQAHFSYYEDASRMLDYHTIKKGADGDGRDGLLLFTKSRFQRALDPKLGSLAEMIHTMMRQIRPEYAYLDPPPAKDHLHEVMRRLLLEQILKMQAGGNPISLIPGCPRRIYHNMEYGKESKTAAPAKRKSTHQSGRSTGSKRAKAQNHQGTTGGTTGNANKKSFGSRVDGPHGNKSYSVQNETQRRSYRRRNVTSIPPE